MDRVITFVGTFVLVIVGAVALLGCCELFTWLLYELLPKGVAVAIDVAIVLVLLAGFSFAMMPNQD